MANPTDEKELLRSVRNIESILGKILELQEPLVSKQHMMADAYIEALNRKGWRPAND